VTGRGAAPRPARISSSAQARHRFDDSTGGPPARLRRGIAASVGRPVPLITTASTSSVATSSSTAVAWRLRCA
jgi:hypothetical protein